MLPLLGSNQGPHDPQTDTWTQMASNPVSNHASGAGFSIGTKGYFGTGGGTKDFYEWDQTTNTWTQRANFGGSGREGGLGIEINGKGYIGTGGSYLKDWWEYDPVTDTWTQKADLAGPPRYHGGAFSINGKGYICTGFNGSFMNDLWEYDPILNSWTAKSPMPGTTRDRPVGLAANGKGYIVTGWTGSTAMNDAWEYDPASDSWTSIPNFPGTARYNACGFTVGNKIYVGTGTPNTSTFYEYGPTCTVQAATTPSTCHSSCDGTATVNNPSGTATYIWSTGDTAVTVNNLCPGTYMVTIIDSVGCSNSSNVIVASPPAITGAAVITEPTCNGDGDGGACFTPSGGTPPYTGMIWSTGDTTNCIVGVPAGPYYVVVTDSTGCTDTNQVVITEPGLVTVTMNGTNASCATCANGSASGGVSGGTPPFTYLWSTGATFAFINNLLPGTYTFCATDAHNCTGCDSIVISYTSSIADLFDGKVVIGPNPVNELLQVVITDQHLLPVVLEVYDTHGRITLVKELQQPRTIIDCSQLAEGIYLAQLRAGAHKGQLKFIKAFH